jgi:glycyl-tRNA synthetase beta chain
MSGQTNGTDQTAGSGAEQPLPLLLEIGTEEIPARFLPGALSDLRTLAAGIVDEYRLSLSEIQTFATPRRLVLIIKGLPSGQRDITKEVFGPSKNAAFDEQGNPTKAATGFARSLGIEVSDLKVMKKGKSDYVAAIIEEKGRETKSVLPEALRKFVLSLRFAKNMRWGDGALSFVRPIHWIAAVFGPDTISFEIDGIRSSNISRGHRFLAPGSFQIKDISAFENILAKNYVILDQEKRRQIIEKGIRELAERAGGRPVMDEGLITTVNFLVEFPVPVLCGFEPEYLGLPKELLITVMKDHQKYFAVRNDEGNLLPHFVVISNTREENSETIRTGAERVIRARFDDAKFYFEEDRKKSLIERVEDLKDVTFHDKLGNLREKTDKVASLAGYLADRVDPSLKEFLLRAALLSKTDLITGVVREFPELQGIMGKYYADHDAEDGRVAAALEEQYLPHSFGGQLPETDIGSLLSLSDKIDNVASFFKIGLVPTGSEDPFALRRQAMGIVAILIGKSFRVSLRDIFLKALQNLSHIRSTGDVMDTISGFMEQRLEYILTSMGFAQDLVKSVLPLSFDVPPAAIVGRAEALKKFREDKTFPDFLLAVKRAHNIIPRTDLPSVREDLLSQPEEKHLFDSLIATREKITGLVNEEEFEEGLHALSGMTGPINNFFDKVLVMDKNEEIRSNRLSLLREVRDLAWLFADFSKTA